VDPAYLERERLKLQAEKAAAARELGSYSLGAGGTTQQQQHANGIQLYGGTNGIVPTMVNVAPLPVPDGQGGGTFGQGQGVTSQGGDSVGQGKEIANASPGSVQGDRDTSQPHPVSRPSKSLLSLLLNVFPTTATAMCKQVVSSIYSHQRSAHVVWKVQVTFQETSSEDEAKV
jgi:hypothetical protein